MDQLFSATRICSSFNCCSVTVVGASAIRSMAFGRLREGDDLPANWARCQQHDDAVQTQRNAAVGRCAVFERFEEEAESGRGLPPR